jgi:acetylornithine/succinyldiaminopimelate/putrescine aminotransferase
MIRYLRQPPAVQNLSTSSNVTSTVLGTTLALTNTANSTSKFSGALTVAGGIGVAGDVYASLLHKGLIVNAVNASTLRFAPPLTVSDAEIDEALALVREALS